MLKKDIVFNLFKLNCMKIKNNHLVQIFLNKPALIQSLKKMPVLFLVIMMLVLSGCENSSGPIPQVKIADAVLKAGDEYFQIAVIPDMQYYTYPSHGGTLSMLQDQITWIKANKTTSGIAYVIQLGDLVEHGDDGNATEWTRAKTEMYKLETDNIPYGTAVGNHDQTPNGFAGSPGTNTGYGVWFGRDHMSTKSWYGGAYGTSNNSDNHYDLFTANGVDYIVLYIEFNSPGHEQYSASIETAVMSWADGVLNTYSSRKAIIVSHSILDKPTGSTSDIKAGQGNNNVASAFTNQGDVIYGRMKLHSNVFLMLCGHISGEGFRQDTYNGNVIKSYLSDYQSRQNSPYGGETNRNGGNGLMRLMKFNKTAQTLSVRTFAPKTGANILEVDGDSQFSMPLYN